MDPQAIEDLAKLAQVLAVFEKEISIDVKQKKMTTEEQVRIGQHLWDLIKQANKALEPIKGNLRREALKRGGGKPGTHHFYSQGGCRGTVGILQPQVKIREDADLHALLSILGSQFDILFETTYKPREDFQKKVIELGEKEALAVAKAVDIKDGGMRVSFGMQSIGGAIKMLKGDISK